MTSLDCNKVPSSQRPMVAHLIESVLSAVADVDQLDDLGLQPLVEHVGLGELGFEVGRPGQDQSGHVGLVVGEEEGDGGLGHFPHVVVTLLHPQPGEPQRGLPASAVLLRQVHSELVEDVPGVPLQCPEQSSVTVHHDETESEEEIVSQGEGSDRPSEDSPVVVSQEGCEGFCVELVITEIQGGVDRFEWLEVNVDFLLLPFLCDYRTTVNHLNHKTVSEV